MESAHGGQLAGHGGGGQSGPPQLSQEERHRSGGRTLGAQKVQILGEVPPIGLDGVARQAPLDRQGGQEILGVTLQGQESDSRTDSTGATSSPRLSPTAGCTTEPAATLRPGLSSG